MSTLTLYFLEILGTLLLLLGGIALLAYGVKKHHRTKNISLQKRKENQYIPNISDESAGPHLRLKENQLTIDAMAKQLTLAVDCTYPNWEARKVHTDPWLAIRKESNRHLSVIFLSNFGKEAREAHIELFAPIPEGELLHVCLIIKQMKIGEPTELTLSDSLYVFSGETDDNVFPHIQLSDESQRWKVKSIYTTDRGSWCLVKPALGTLIQGSATLQISTTPKPHNSPSRNATVNIECGTYPFNTVKHITLMQGVVFSYYIEYPVFDICSRTYGAIETPLNYKAEDPIKQYTIYIRCNLRWRLIKENSPWVTISEPNLVAEKYDGSFNVQVFPNDAGTLKNGYCAARHSVISIVTETGLVKDILIYQGGYVIVKGKYWLDRNLLDYHQVTQKAIPIGLVSENMDIHGTHFQYGNPDKQWKAETNPLKKLWNQNVEEHVVKNDDFDPSPAGWRVPSSLELRELYSRFNIQGNQLEEFAEKDSDTYIQPHRYFSLSSDSGVPIFFPLSGYRSHINGSLMDVGVLGRYWSSAETSTIYAKALSLDRGKATYITHYLKKHGFPIRSILS